MKNDPLQNDNKIDICGSWQVRLDRDNRGIEQRWFSQIVGRQIALPGSLQHARIGDPITKNTPWMCECLTFPWFCDPTFAPARDAIPTRVPYWLQPETYYTGVAWYQRIIDIPETWRGKRITLTLERAHWQTEIWLDDNRIGASDSLCTPHVYDFGVDLQPGPHTLTIRVDNSMIVDIGINSHSISDHTQGNWNGIVGRIELTATEQLWIDTLDVFPDISSKSIKVTGRVNKTDTATMPHEIELRVKGASDSTRDQIFPVLRAPVSTDGSFSARIDLGPSAQLWDEFSPALYQLNACICDGQSKGTLFGLRSISRQGRRFLLNGRAVYFRGTLDCCAFPKTGHPPTDVPSWKKLMRTVKAHGLNMIRFHSWCPPEAAFIAADELGLYLQLEVASWSNTTVTLGDSKPVDAWLYKETKNIVRQYANHPSFLLLAYGNEPAGAKHCAYLAQWVNDFRGDARHLLTSAAGWPEIPENDFHITYKPRVYLWTDELRSRINALPPETRTDYRNFIAQQSVPVISHEIGQWCAYPNFDEMPKYTGYLKPRNFEIYQESLSAHHMAHKAHDFLLASGKLQALCYKEEIESALRTPEMGGFQLLALSDFPGQGTALVGVLDSFWESKGYITAQEFSRFSGAIVPLARMDKRIWTSDEHFYADVELAHYGPSDLPPLHATWSLIADDGTLAAQGTFPEQRFTSGTLAKIGRIDIPLQTIPAPFRYKLTLQLSGTEYCNDWDIWIYPSSANICPPADVHVAHQLDAKSLAILNAGGKVLLCLDPRTLPESAGLGFSSIFWNTVWTRRQKPYTLGILCDPKHPALRHFPTDFHSNWQWWYPIHHAQAMILDHLPPALEPIVQVIDDWNTNRKMALLFECTIGRGKLMVCSVDLEKAPDPVNRQLLASLLKYMASDAFSPTLAVTQDQIHAISTGGPPPAIPL